MIACDMSVLYGGSSLKSVLFILIDGRDLKRISTTSIGLSGKNDTISKELFLGCFIRYNPAEKSKTAFIYKTTKNRFKLVDTVYIEHALNRKLTNVDTEQLCDALSTPIENIQHILEFLRL